MPRSRPSIEFGRERGSASLEFLAVGTLLLVPLVYLVVAVAALQGGALAAEAGARQAARSFVEAESADVAAQRAHRAVAFALSDHGLDPAHATVRIACSPAPERCLSRLGIVTVGVEVAVPMPLVPAGLDLTTPLTIPIEASASQRVSRFGEAP